MSQFGSQGGHPGIRPSVGSTGQGTGPAHIAPMPKMPHPPAADETSPIGLINEDEVGVTERKIRAVGISDSVIRRDQYKRQPATTGQGACRCRSFHGRLSGQGLEYMDNQINEWLDQHPEVEVKFVTSTVGLFEGKIREQAIVMTLWY